MRTVRRGKVSGVEKKPLQSGVLADACICKLKYSGAPGSIKSLVLKYSKGNDGGRAGAVAAGCYKKVFRGPFLPPHSLWILLHAH